jgi:beta-mannanase
MARLVARRSALPGDRYVNWIGLSAYGTQPGSRGIGESLRSIMDREYPRLAALSRSKPLALMEFGVDEGTHPAQRRAGSRPPSAM